MALRNVLWAGSGIVPDLGHEWCSSMPSSSRRSPSGSVIANADSIIPPRMFNQTVFALAT